MGLRWRRTADRLTLDGSGSAGRAAQGRAIPIVRDQMERLSRVVRVRTRFTHDTPIGTTPHPGTRSGAIIPIKVMNPVLKPNAGRRLHRDFTGRCAAALALVALACGPRARIPMSPQALPGAVASTDSVAILARGLAPVLYLQPDESFQLSRVVAVVHPTRPIVAYHLLWNQEAHGAWLPFTVATDQEIVWVGYDSTGAPTDLWTYWHGWILHTRWSGGTPAVDVQWGKHGSLPRGTKASQLPWRGKLGLYWLAGFAVPDLLLGRITRPGPLCFCHGYGRYRRFSRPLALAQRLDAIVQTDDPDAALTRVFGKRYSRKIQWPWRVAEAHPSPLDRSRADFGWAAVA